MRGFSMSLPLLIANQSVCIDLVIYKYIVHTVNSAKFYSILFAMESCLTVNSLTWSFHYYDRLFVLAKCPWKHVHRLNRKT